MSEFDVHSHSQPNRVRVTHCSLSLIADFESQILRGSVKLRLQRSDPNAPLFLDTRDLDVKQITWQEAQLPFRLGSRDPILGSALEIDLPPHADLVTIQYTSLPHASGLQWLMPEQTAGRSHPFLFSQNQSIHARSWIPIQDSPAVRITYTARIKAPENLRVVMAAEPNGVEDGFHLFRMDLPIPAYLVAIAIGHIEFAAVGPRTGVYAEPCVLPAAAQEFEDLEKLVDAVERLYGPYRWGRYEILILPPSFPFGGMENPIVTFATPTIIAGDKSLVSLVSHELAHSWSGNLVTNATWSDFWLNEGFTTYIENRIQEEVYGREQALMEQVLDRRELDKELTEFPPGDQILHIDLFGRDPDDGTTRVPYIKGALLLRQMEHVFGRPVFDDFLKRYFDQFAFQSIRTEEALTYFRRQLFDLYPEGAAQVPLDEWVFQAGLPSSAPEADSRRLQPVSELARRWFAGDMSTVELSAGEWITQEWLEFMQTLPRPIDQSKLAELDRAFNLTSSNNYEILQEWLLIAIESDYQTAFSRLEIFLMEVGRIKFLKPLYTHLMMSAAGASFSRLIYKRARPRYHPIARAAIDKIVYFSR
jgi:leukotriene-A4 hydrolase